jgi:hypothetical protein
MCAGVIDEAELAAAVDTIISEQRMKKVGKPTDESHLHHAYA